MPPPPSGSRLGDGWERSGRRLGRRLGDGGEGFGRRLGDVREPPGRGLRDVWETFGRTQVAGAGDDGAPQVRRAVVVVGRGGAAGGVAPGSQRFPQEGSLQLSRVGASARQGRRSFLFTPIPKGGLLIFT